MRDHLFSFDKIKYVKGERPKVDCILCAIRDMHPEVTSLEVKRTENFIIAVNLYPYNSGHIMIFPHKHMETVADFTNEEALEMHYLLSQSISILKEEFNPSGFNIGYNIGLNSGASISHIHQHIVPRYNNEIGFIDILAGVRVLVVDPVEVMHRLRKRFNDI